MLIDRIRHIREVTASGFTYTQIHNPFHNRFYVVPKTVTLAVDLDKPFPEGLISVSITGQRWRHLADGSEKAVPPGRKGSDTEPTTWTFGAGHGIPVSCLPQTAIDLAEKILRNSY